VPPRIRLHPRLQTAVTVGWRRPVVLLPAVWAAWPPDRLDVVVRHELAHVGRGDYATSLAAAAVAAVFWFVPGVWLAARRMRWFAELAADASAAGVVGRALYARQLLEAAGGAVRHGSGPFRLVVGAPGAGPRLRFGAVDLQRRVAALLDER
jgi:beta-lactamase regulating signal transducer with metallopeptidase domain